MKLICQLKVQTELNLSFFLKYECSVHRILYITESCKQAEAEVVPSSSLVKIRMSLRLSLRLRLKLKRLRSLRLKLGMLRLRRLRFRSRLRLVLVRIPDPWNFSLESGLEFHSQPFVGYPTSG